MTQYGPPTEGVSTPPNLICNITCPDCKAPPGQSCRTVIDGRDVGWTHDARVYAHMGVRHA